MLIDITFEEALKKLKNPKQVLENQVIPREFSSISHSPYRAGYDWLFSYERKLFRFLESWLGRFRHQLIGETGILSEALSNAYYHGHEKNRSLPIGVTVNVGEEGLLIRIADKGKGFDMAAAVRDFFKGKPYYRLAGNGLRLMIRSKRFGVFYNKRGNVFHMLYLFSDDLASFEASELKGHGGPQTAFLRKTPSALSPLNTKTQSKPFIVEPPHDSNWARSAILTHKQDRPAVAFNMDSERAQKLTGTVGRLLESVERFSRHLHAGRPGMVRIHTDRTTAIIAQDLEEDHVLILFLEEGGNPALAAHHVSRLLRYLLSRQKEALV